VIAPRMPNVSPRRDIAACFARARRLSESGPARWVVIIAPDGALVKVPVPAPEAADPTLLRDARLALAPEGEPATGQVITAVNCTAGVQARARSFFRLLELMPNLSHLVGAACLGNVVVSFEGYPGDFPAGCAGADVLILDDGMVPFLQPDWAAVALRTLRQPRVLQFGRDGLLKRLTRLVEVERQGHSP